MSIFRGKAITISKEFDLSKRFYLARGLELYHSPEASDSDSSREFDVFKPFKLARGLGLCHTSEASYSNLKQHCL